MWIKSQDKQQLLGITGSRVYVVNKAVFVDMNDEITGIENIGEYTTHERAIQVLDSIYKAKKNGKSTYSMPKE